MKQKMFLVGLCLAVAGMTHAQTKGGGISPQMLQKMEKSQQEIMGKDSIVQL